MFATRPDARPPGAPTVEVLVEGRPTVVPEGATAAAALLLAGISSNRTTPVTGAPRLPFCMMGVCFDCLAEIDGVANRQACMVAVRPGMRITRQEGARVAYEDDAA
ncbi:(2Fe-2S)-binding protein [Roseomonas sp. 18066]|uniref:(2Fe-2S)-binding protein n=1 Tax=Roseomonas sp. 18066 TaxID=2681412 RepID=UPI00135CC9FC|nr:(2Fe-2S)-binding protein [Roseomonas sp. 18066]